MKKLLKNLTFGAAILATSLSFGQIDAQITSSASAILTTDGTLDSPIVFTVTGIPETLTGITENANIRIYPTAVTTAGGQVSSFQVNGLRLTSETATGDVVTTVTTGDPFTKTYTINKLPIGTGLTAGSTYTIALRFIKAKSVNMLSTTDVNLTAETQATHIIYNVGTVTGTTTLTTNSISSAIEGASVTANNGNITVSGANLEAVYAITGQQVGTTGLASGVYIVQISKGNGQDTVKVIVE